jgi:hypothetical protein
MLRSAVALAVASVLFVTAPARAVEYFVDFDAEPGVDCSDAGPGSDPRAGGTPWCTLPGTRVTAYEPSFLPGPWARIRAGDVVSIKAGTTHTTADGAGAALISHAHYDDGTAAARIVVRKHPAWGSGDHAAFDGTGMATQRAGVVNVFGVDYVTLDALEVANAPDMGIDVNQDAHHVVIDHAYVHDGRGTALVFLSACTTTPCMQILRNSTLAHAEHGGGVLVYDNPGGYVLVENNVVHHVCGGLGVNLDGIQCGGPNATTNFCAMRGNLIYAHGTHSGYPQGCGTSDPISTGGGDCHHNALVEDNEVRDSSGRLLMHGPYEDDCHDEDGLNGYNVIRRNRLTNIDIISYGYPNDTIFYNNTLYNPAVANMVQIYSTEPKEEPTGTSYGTPLHVERVAEIGRDTDLGRLTLKNNILWGQQSYHVLLNGVPGFRVDARWSSFRIYFNLYSAFRPLYWYPDDVGDTAFYGNEAAYRASRATDPPDVGSIFSNAALGTVFVDAPDGDFHLVPGSPAIDAGTAVTHAVGASGDAGSTELRVERASFVDGWQGLLEPDRLRVGDCADVAIAAIDDFDATIQLAAPCRWNDGDPVNLASQGAAPDLGAFELDAPPVATPIPSATPQETPSATPTPAVTPDAACGAGCGACEACVPGVGCRPALRNGCRRSTKPADDSFQITNARTPSFRWLWAKGEATTLAELGRPLAGDRYTLCVFDESGAAPAVAMQATTGVGQCGRRPCWKPSGKTAYTYADAARAADGLAGVLLRAGAAGKAEVVVTGKGPNLDLPPLPLGVPLRVQLHADGGSCWESRFLGEGRTRNDTKRFKGRGAP